MLRPLLWNISALLVGASTVHAQEPPKTKPVDLVICLDVSGSMNGLIESAKIKLWAIVNDLAKGQPTPFLRVSIYSYGASSYDPSKGWVRKELDLTTDLDEVYKKLTALSTGGGEEYVARVTQTALAEQKWSAEKDALKLIFVCGNEPVNQDPQVKLDEVAAVARKQDVFINTIYCGNPNVPEALGWREFAATAGGKYACIDQSKAAREVVINSPFDKDILLLNAKLNETYIAYGKQGELGARNQALQDANAGKLAPGVALERAASKATAQYRNEHWDLGDRLKSDKTFDMKTLKDEELPELLRAMKPEEREAYVKKKLEEREAIQKKIHELSVKRAAYCEEERKKLPKNEHEKAFDEALRSMLRDQAQQRGLTIPK